jgi:HTH-type transcriptional regulator / antitoxin HigA
LRARNATKPQATPVGLPHRGTGGKSPPGAFIRKELAARNWSQAEFAEIIGKSVRTVNEIIVGRRQITPETATVIAAALGKSAQFWMNLENAYRLARIEPAPERISHEARLRGG